MQCTATSDRERRGMQMLEGGKGLVYNKSTVRIITRKKYMKIIARAGEGNLSNVNQRDTFELRGTSQYTQSKNLDI